jgi:hypothetical protein
MAPEPRIRLPNGFPIWGAGWQHHRSQPFLAPDGHIYPSVRVCADALGKHHSTIHYHLKRSVERRNGWQYL